MPGGASALGDAKSAHLVLITGGGRDALAAWRLLQPVMHGVAAIVASDPDALRKLEIGGEATVVIITRAGAEGDRRSRACEEALLLAGVDASRLRRLRPEVPGEKAPDLLDLVEHLRREAGEDNETSAGDRLCELLRDAPPMAAPDRSQAPGPEGGPGATPFTDWTTFWSKDRSEPEWVIENVLARRRGHAIWAKGGNGKSEFMQWAALEAIKAGHVVIYLDYEMIDDDLYDRLTDFGLGPETDLSRLRYALIPSLRPLDEPEGAEELAALIDGVQAEFPDRHLVVVIDTIGRAVGGEENSNDTILAFYRHSGAVLKARGVTWVRLDHAGHEGSHARGGSAKRDDVDVVWKHERTDSGCRLVADKRRASWIPESATFDRREAPNLRYEPVPWSWPAGTMDVADLLTELGVPADASTRTAERALQEAGKGRRRTVVTAAQKYRAQRAGTTSGTTPSGSGGNHSGTIRTNPRNDGPEPLPGPLGTTTVERVGTTGVPLRGTTGARSRSDRCGVCGKRRQRTEPGEPTCRCAVASEEDLRSLLPDGESAVLPDAPGRPRAGERGERRRR